MFSVLFKYNDAMLAMLLVLTGTGDLYNLCKVVLRSNLASVVSYFS